MLQRVSSGNGYTILHQQMQETRFSYTVTTEAILLHAHRVRKSKLMEQYILQPPNTYRDIADRGTAHAQSTGGSSGSYYKRTPIKGGEQAIEIALTSIHKDEYGCRKKG